MSEFDRIADSYRDDVESGMVLRGNDHGDFQAYKMLYLGKIIKKYNVRKLLDYGCGVGTLSQVIHTSFPNVTIHGYDISSKSIENVPMELKKYPNFFTSDYKMLDHDYDLVILSTVRFITFLGLFSFLISASALIFSLISYFFFRNAVVTGWTSIFFSLWAIGGLILLSIGLIGEYIGKIYLETKRRPRYFVDKILD